ncbi:MAG: hypothetical protein NVSMB12_13300 [Acidimicrobiales bacterium]
MVTTTALALVVEDTEALRAVMTVALESAGYRVVTASDGAATIAAVRDETPDVVLLDLVLPDSPGLEILDHLKAEPRTAAAPVLVVTARDETSVTADALRRGAHDLVVKPFRMPDLLARVDAAVRMKREHDRLAAARKALHDQVEFTEAVMNTIDCIVVVLDGDGRVVRFNRAAEEISGFAEEELAGRSMFDVGLMASEETGPMWASYVDFVRGELVRPKGTRIEARWMTRFGGVRSIAWSNTTLYGPDGDFAFTVATGIDVTDLREADRRLHACLDVMPGSIFILDPVRGAGGHVDDFHLRYMNHEAESMLPPAALKDALASGARQFMTEDQFAMLLGVIRDGTAVDDEARVELDGHLFTFAYSVARFGESVVLNLRDVTDVRAAQDRLAWAATHDALTGLAGRGLLVDRLRQALARRRADAQMVVGVLFVDLDGFKSVNDDLGHASGDAMLIAVARALEATVRPADTVARYGGDEFVVVVESLPSAEDVATLADRLSQAVAAIELDGHRLRASVGLAIATPEDDPDAILRLADHVMYEKKRHAG